MPVYDPLVGRFLEEDPIDFAAGDPNLFRYVHNSPTNATDPSGLAGEDGDFNNDGEVVKLPNAEVKWKGGEGIVTVVINRTLKNDNNAAAGKWITLKVASKKNLPANEHWVQFIRAVASDSDGKILDLKNEVLLFRLDDNAKTGAKNIVARKFNRSYLDTGKTPNDDAGKVNKDAIYIDVDKPGVNSKVRTGTSVLFGDRPTGNDLLDQIQLGFPGQAGCAKATTLVLQFNAYFVVDNVLVYEVIWRQTTTDNKGKKQSEYKVDIARSLPEGAGLLSDAFNKDGKLTTGTVFKEIGNVVTDTEVIYDNPLPVSKK